VPSEKQNEGRARERSEMRIVLIVAAIVVVLAAVVVLSHLALIEVGREVVTLRTPDPDGGWKETRLWIVDDGDGAAWLHSAGASWARRFEGDPIVEVKRNGATKRYKAHPVPGPHPRIDALLREKYGMADRWVRFVAPCGDDTLPVRLEPVSD
jgi:hypothetical protein